MFFDQNPVRLSHSDDPRRDIVRIERCPERFQDILSNYDFAYPGWHMNFGKQPNFYIDGLDQALRLFSQNTPSFLKTDGYVDEAVKQPAIGEWAFKSGVKINTISRQRISQVREHTPQPFAICVLIIVAFEYAIRADADRLGISPFWAYEYLRVLPAVYNIHRFDADKLTLLTDHYHAFEDQLLQACKQEDPRLLVDLTLGKTVTRATALRIKHHIDHHCCDDSLHAVGDVRCEPGQNSKLGTGPATQFEFLKRDHYDQNPLDIESSPA